MSHAILVAHRRLPRLPERLGFSALTGLLVPEP